MTQIVEFTPIAGYPGILKNWMITGVVIAILVIVYLSSHSLLLAGVGILYIAIFIRSTRLDVKVIISGPPGTFTMRSVDLFKKERDISLMLSTAQITYNFERINKRKSGFRLRLSENNNNKIVITESNDSSRYNKEQLDQMVALINKYREPKVGD